MAQHKPTRAGEALETVRKERDLSQEKFARTLGMSRSTYIRRITGQADFTGREIVLTLGLYDVALAGLI